MMTVGGDSDGRLLSGVKSSIAEMTMTAMMTIEFGGNDKTIGYDRSVPTRLSGLELSGG
jgi:hypothetical protein